MERTPATDRTWGAMYGGTPRQAGSSTYPSRTTASEVIPCKPEEGPCPEELLPLHGIHGGVIQAEAREGHLRRIQGEGQEDRPVPVRESPEVVDPAEGPRLGCPDDRPGK